MNGYGQNGGDVGQPPMLRTSTPKNHALVDAYRQGGINGQRKAKPRYNPNNPGRVQTSNLLDLKDSVQVHLLAENALFDSKEYEILSQEEVDDLKKEYVTLNTRIERTRSELAMQSKLRDGAESVSKLISPTSGRRMSPSEADMEEARQAQAELETINKKCEDLASELWSLEKESMETQRRLLEHTAGILQFTNKTVKKHGNAGTKVPLVNGVPASPESMHTSTNGRNSIDPDEFFIFDQGSLYQSFHDLDLFGSGGGNAFDIPAKSPMREDNKQLVEESERLRSEVNQLRSQASETERRLAHFNTQLREAISSTHPGGPISPGNPASNLMEQLAYLGGSVQTVGEELQRAVHGGVQQSEGSETVLTDLWELIQSGYASIRQQRADNRKARMEKGLEIDEEDKEDVEIDTDEPYSLSAFSSRVRWLYSQATSLQDQKFVLKRQIKQQRELNSRSDSEKDQAMRDKIEELEQTRGLLDQNGRDTDTIRAELSQALEDLEQMRANHSDGDKAIDEAQAILKERNAKLQGLQTDMANTTAQLQQANEQLQQANEALQEAQDAKAAAEQDAEAKQANISAKEEELGQMTAMVAELKMENTLAKAELDGAYGTRQERAKEAAAMHDQSEVTRMHVRIETLEKELKATAKDLTDVVQTSLDSERKIGELEAELDKISSERTRLRDEKERVTEDLEQQLREAEQEAQQRLETELGRLRTEKNKLAEELDHERLRGAASPLLSPGGTSKTSYLTESYRTGLRAERKKYEEQLRAEQTARRKIEEELRALKRAQGPGKSPLSPRT